MQLLGSAFFWSTVAVWTALVVSFVIACYRAPIVKD